MRTTMTLAIAGIALQLSFSFSQAANLVSGTRTANVSAAASAPGFVGQTDTQSATGSQGVTTATINGSGFAPAAAGQGPLSGSWSSQTQSLLDARNDHGRLYNG